MTRAEEVFKVPTWQKIGPLELNGTGTQEFWNQALELPPFALGSEFKTSPYQKSRASILRAGGWLLLGIEGTETDGIVARESIHNGDLWFDDTFTATLAGSHTLEISMNPLGATRTSVDKKLTLQPIQQEQIRVAARILDKKWRVEVAINLELIGDTMPITLRLARERQLRGGQAFERTESPGSNAAPLQISLEKVLSLPMEIAVAPFQVFAERIKVTAGRCEQQPADEPEWSRMPSSLLWPEDGSVPLTDDFQQSEVRIALSRSDLTFHIRCLDKNNNAENTDDKLEIFMGPERFGYIQFVVDSNGHCTTVEGKTGGKYPKKIQGPEGIKSNVVRSKNGWVCVLSVPLAGLLQQTEASELQHPEKYPWRVQVIRNYPARADLGQNAQSSLLAPTFSSTAHCPLRFAELKLVNAAAQSIPSAQFPKPELPLPVLDAEQRAKLHPETALMRSFSARADLLHQQSQAALEQITDAESWKKLAKQKRAALLKALFPAFNGALPARGDLNLRIVYEIKGEGFSYQGIVFESFPELPIAATLYLPTEPAPAQQKRPALIMVGAHHNPGNNQDMQILGANFARAGGVALAFDNIGAGERSISALWEHTTYQRCLWGQQALLTGETPNGINTFELMRCVDVLLERPDVDPTRLALVGGVAGGGDLAALAAAIDERISVAIPFNFSVAQPFGLDHDPLRMLPGVYSGGYESPWWINALIAPRHLIVAHEFDWTDTLDSAFQKTKRVYELLEVPERLAHQHGGPNTHANHFAQLHRMPIYRQLHLWWKMPLPESEDKEYLKTVPREELTSFRRPEGRAALASIIERSGFNEPHQIWADIARKRLRLAKESNLSETLNSVFGHVQVSDPTPQVTRTFEWKGYSGTGHWLPILSKNEPATTEGLGLALWILQPTLEPQSNRKPMVVCVSEAGKVRFLYEREEEIKTLLKAGIAVVLLDLRGCGESSPCTMPFPDDALGGLAYKAFMLGENLPGQRLQDLRNTLRFLMAQKFVDPARVAIWGEGFSHPCEASPFEETQFRQCSPQPVELLQGTGSLLALSAALTFESPKPVAVLVRGGAANYLSAMENRSHALPMDGIVPGLLTVADVPDLIRGLRAQKITVFAEDLRDTENHRLSTQDVQTAWGPQIFTEYHEKPTRATVEKLIQVLKP